MSLEGRATSNEQAREDSTGLAQGLAKRLSVDAASGQAKKQKQKPEPTRRSVRRGGTAAAAGTGAEGADAVDRMEAKTWVAPVPITMAPVLPNRRESTV